MKNPTLSQLHLIAHHRKEAMLHALIPEEEFIFSFLNHLTEHFQQQQALFRILEPLLDPSMVQEQETVLSVDGVEVGELHLLFNSFFDESSLVYYSPSGLLELFLLEYEDYETLTCSDYLLLIHEFAALLNGEKMLYEKRQKRPFEQ